MKSESGMSYEEAVKVLGLKRGETVDNYQRAFEEVRKHMQRLRDEADTAEKRANYELELARFEEALVVAERHQPKKKKIVAGLFVGLVLVGLVGGGVVLGPKFLERQDKLRAAEARLPEAAEAVDLRNWGVAEKIYEDILKLKPKSQEALEGLKTVEIEQEVERRMQVRFALGNVQSHIDKREWDEAEEQMKKVLAMEPDDEQLKAFAESMKENRRLDEIASLSEGIEQARIEEQWEVLVAKTEELAKVDPENPRLPEFEKEVAEAKLILLGYRQEADEIYEKALALDNGEFSLEALNLLREAQRLAPSEKAAALYEKMSSYVQTLAVPDDVPTLAEALEQARSGDKVILSEGKYSESLLVPAGVSIEGVKGKTILETSSDEGSVLVVSGKGAPARLVGLTIRHSGVSNADERFPVVLIQGAQAVLENCEVSYGAGHGVAVIDGARCEITSTEIKGCGWDGVAVTGEGSEAILQESRCTANLHHGLDAWDGARVWVQRSRFQDNGLTGIFLTSSGKECRVESSSIERNREVGIVASSGVHALVNGNLISGNMLGGVFAQDKGTKLTVTSNTIEKNGEVGLVVTKDVLLEKEEDNSAQENDGRQKWLNADLTQVEAKPKSEEILKALPVD
ncbi:right-handed parallel beta-helix repeat-containing protein [Roseibacillus persicicus]|uniref:right-handed parallel beta-helix repeat-containing protein n=1 Tax=Roseibacillus persicicus TaxID=454148 RepID=UPI00280D9969|nr:right-handed parallel beta-helix repeat-containing protein [Roseibacillus persicicus]MDQ8190169.1 right-handed parallel beta-helix repeat-containing protein [Roseibacillus persicicus]